LLSGDSFFLPGGAENLPSAAMRGSIFLQYFSTKAAEAKSDPVFGNAGENSLY
jgi:hypothetical protein